MGSTLSFKPVAGAPSGVDDSEGGRRVKNARSGPHRLEPVAQVPQGRLHIQAAGEQPFHAEGEHVDGVLGEKYAVQLVEAILVCVCVCARARARVRVR